MPGTYIHEQLTAEAIPASGVVFSKTVKEALIHTYAQLPDFYFGRQKELEKYQFFTDGIQFHYLPDTPWNDIYRYWGYDADGNMIHVRPFHNENYIHAIRGFRYFLERTLTYWREGNTDEGCKYLGCLLHTLEDSTFGCHSTEGPHGVDFFALNRLSGENPLGFICQIEPDHEPLEDMPEHPVILGNTVDDAAMMLYSRYVRTVCEARHCCFREALRYFNGAEKPSSESGHFMRRNSVILLAEVIATAEALAEGKRCLTENRMLSDLEPVEFPFSGCGKFRFKTPLVEGNTISFGLQTLTNLLYDFPSEEYTRLTAMLTLKDYTLEKTVELDIFNEGMTVQHLSLENDKSYPIQIECPRGECGLKFKQKDASGCIILQDARLVRR